MIQDAQWDDDLTARPVLQAWFFSSSGIRMRLNHYLLIPILVLTVPAVAQSAGEGGGNECKAQVAIVERDMEIARSKGQMLRRRQLAGELAALQARCEPAPTKQSRAANIERLEQEIRDLRTELEQAEEHLRKLKGEAG